MAFCEKPPKRVDLFKTSNFFVQTTMFQGFEQIFIFCANYHVLGFWANSQQNVAKAMALCEKPQKLVDLFKANNFFVQTTMFQGFEPIFSKTLHKLWHFVKNHQNVSISSKLTIFFGKLPCFRVLSKFLAKSCKNYGIL